MSFVYFLMLVGICVKITQEACFPRVKEQPMPVPFTPPTELEQRLATRIVAQGPRVYIEDWSPCPPHFSLKPEVRPDLRAKLTECRECGIVEGYPCQM